MLVHPSNKRCPEVLSAKEYSKHFKADGTVSGEATLPFSFVPTL